MSTEPQSPFGPGALAYDEARVGRTVRSATLMRAAASASINASARPGKRAQVHSAYPNGTSARTYAVSYTRTTDAVKALYVGASIRSATFGDTLTIDLTIRDAAGHSVASSSALIPNPFKGTVIFLDSSAGSATYDARTIGVGYLDIDALAATLTDPDWSLEFAVAAPNGHDSLVDLIEVYEVPRRMVDSADAAGSLALPFLPGNPLASGDATGSLDDGVTRLEATAQAARTSQRTYWQECFGPDDTTATLPLTTSGTYAALTNHEQSAGVPIEIALRVRKVTGATGGETARVRVRYLVTSGGTAYVRATTGIGTSDSAGLTSATWAWSDWWTIFLKTSAAGQVDSITLKAKTSAGTLYLSSVIVDENVT